MVDRAAWFEWEGDLPLRPAKFLDAVRSEAESWLDADPMQSQVYEWEDRIVIGLDVSDRVRGRCLRVLRVDYDASGLAYGDDETGQFASDLTPKQHEYGHIGHDSRSPADLGRMAATWLRTQMIRPIELVEWDKWNYWCQQYRLKDTGRRLSWSAEGNQLKPNLGAPDRVSIIMTLGDRC